MELVRQQASQSEESISGHFFQSHFDFCYQNLLTYPGDLAVRFFMALGLKRRTPNKKLVTQNAQTPEVYLLVVSFAFDHLWRQVVERAAQRGPPVDPKPKQAKELELTLRTGSGLKSTRKC